MVEETLRPGTRSGPLLAGMSQCANPASLLAAAG